MGGDSKSGQNRCKFNIDHSYMSSKKLTIKFEKIK